MATDARLVWRKVEQYAADWCAQLEAGLQGAAIGAMQLRYGILAWRPMSRSLRAETKTKELEVALNLGRAESLDDVVESLGESL